MGADTLPRDLTEVFAVPTDTGIALLAWSDADGRHRIDKISRDLRSAAPLFETTTPFYVLGSAPGALALCLQDRPGVIFVDVATGVGRDSLSTSHEPTLRPRWMAFRDMLHGAALFPGLGLHVTRDGGASFQPVVPLRGFSDENLAAYDWQSDGLLLRAPERGNRVSDAGPSFCRISEETASCEEATNPLRPLERWLETDYSEWHRPMSSTFAAGLQGVVAKDGGALTVTGAGASMPYEGTVFAHVDLRTGFLDSAFELPRKNCWLAPRDKQTLWLGCLAKDYSATWVEPVERDMDALRKSAAAFPDMTRAFPTYVLNGGPPRSIGVNDYTATLLSSGSCDRDERSGACILEGRSRRNIAWAPLYGEVAMQDVSDDIFLLNAKNGALLVRQLGTDGRIADVAGSMRVDAVSSVDLVGAYESGPRHITAVLSAHTRPDSFYTVDVSLNDGRASVQPEPNVHDHQLSMDGPRGVECIDGRARRTTDGGTTWSDVALPSAALDTHSSSHRHVVHASEVGIDAGHGYVVGWGDLDSPTPEPAPRPAPIAEPQWVKESSRPSPWALLCARDGRPSTPRSPPESPTVTEVPRPRAYPSWTMSWTDETGSKRVWRGEPPEIAEHVEIRAWKTLGQNAAFVVSYQGPRGDEHTIARAIGDKVELSPPRTGSTDDLAIGAGGVAWHDDVAFLWPAGKPASEIRSVRKVGFDIGIEPPASPGFLTFRMRPPEGAQFLSVADTSSPKDPPPLPVFGWISEDALVSDTPPRACGPNAKASVTVEGGVHLLELERNDDPLPPLESVSVSWGTIRLGYDGALDPKNVCLAGVVAEIGDQRDERGERRLSYRADTGRDVSETEKASQPMRCELMSATEYARRSATRPQ